MEERLAALEQRVRELEGQVAELRHRISRLEPQTDMAAHWRKVLEDLGLQHVKPLGPQRLRQLLIAEGYDPTTNEASRGIIEMREE
jgi:hypothetical protein